jgi:hypothetical protein
MIIEVKKVVLASSSGKDSAWTLYVPGTSNRGASLTTLDQAAERGVDRRFPLADPAFLACTNEEYEVCTREA